MSFLKIGLIFYSISLTQRTFLRLKQKHFHECVCLWTAGPTRSSSWRATLPGPSACLWPTWWKASQRTYTKCTPCPRWSRWGHEEAPPFSTGSRSNATLTTVCSRLSGLARSEGRGLPEHPLRPGQQRPDRRDPHDAEARRGEAAGEERRDPVGRPERAHYVRSTPVTPSSPPRTSQRHHVLALPPSLSLYVCS